MYSCLLYSWVDHSNLCLLRCACTGKVLSYNVGCASLVLKLKQQSYLDLVLGYCGCNFEKKAGSTIKPSDASWKPKQYWSCSL